VVADAVLACGDEVVLRGVHAAPVGATQGAAYVWGIDRGAGVELFPTLDPPTGEGVAFDAAVVLLPDGTGSLIDLATGGATTLDPSSIEISGSVISVSLSLSLLPSQGFDVEDYGYNLWPRYAPDGVDPLDNTQISDFAPDASTFTARPRGRADDWSSRDAGTTRPSTPRPTWWTWWVVAARRCHRPGRPTSTCCEPCAPAENDHARTRVPRARRGPRGLPSASVSPAAASSPGRRRWPAPDPRPLRP
jgi:hypothetical protein